MAKTRANLQQVLDDIAAMARATPDRGQVADYIPELARVDPNQFAIALARPGLGGVKDVVVAGVENVVLEESALESQELVGIS